MRPFRLRFLADLHVNSYWGIWPPNFVSEGVPFAPTPDSVWLWENAFHHLREAPTPDLAVVNGDLTHGKNYKSDGTGVYTQSQDIMNQAASEVVAMMLDTTPWFMVQGTPYHEPSVAHVAHVLGAKPWDTGERYGQILDLKIRGIGVNIAHHPDGGAAIYKGTTMDRMSLWSIISSALGKVFDAPLIVRSHYHFFACWQANGRTVVQTPCWSFPDPHAKKTGYFRYTSDIGWVDLLIDRDEPYPTVESHLIKQDIPTPVEEIDDDEVSQQSVPPASRSPLDASTIGGEELERGGPPMGGSDSGEDDPERFVS